MLTQVVARDRLVEAHAKNALANSGSEVAGPALAGALIRLIGAPLTLLVDAALLVTSAAILRGIRVDEKQRTGASEFWGELKAGLRFVARNKLLMVLGATVGGWQMCNNCATVVNILFATRTAGLVGTERGPEGYVCLGFGTVLASLVGHRISKRFRAGAVDDDRHRSRAASAAGDAVDGAGRAAGALLAFAANLTLFGLGAVMLFINFLAMRQAVTPAPMLGRMTSTMRWLAILLPARARRADRRLARRARRPARVARVLGASAAWC